MKFCFDLDGTICHTKKETETYSDVLPLEGAAETLQSLKQQGHYIIIYTARHMKTCNGDVSLVKEKVGKITEDWLAKHEIPYDELIFGKPLADQYIDDRAIQFKTWKDLILS